MAPLDESRLPEPTDHRDGPALERNLVNLGITVSTAIPHEDFGADLEHTFRRGVAEELSRLVKRWRRELRAARAAERAGEWREMIKHDKSARWAEGRARSLGLPRAELVNACGKRWRTVRCGCGQLELRVGCDQVQLCTTCRRAHWKRWRKRITRALGAHYRAELAAWRRECEDAARRGERRPLGPRIYMVTLTAPHSGNLARDREAFGDGWRKLYKRAHADGWWSHYAAVYEIGEQADLPIELRDGHLHLHVAVIARWLPYEDLHAAWREAMPDAKHVHVSTRAPSTLRARKRTNAVSAASEYLASYVTKGVDPETMTGAKAGELLVAFRGKRKLSTSTHFWRAYVPQPECKLCGLVHRMVKLPGGIVSVAPGAVLRSLAEQHGVWLPRGPTQAELRLSRSMSAPAAIARS